jgi:hypothetical protein
LQCWFDRRIRARESRADRVGAAASGLLRLGEASLVLLIYLGLAWGCRYRLFNLDRWWFEALIWGLGGALVLLFDIALLWLNASAGVALGTAVALAGWLYFPLRQWLWRRLSPAAGCRSSAICRS